LERHGGDVATLGLEQRALLVATLSIASCLVSGERATCATIATRNSAGTSPIS
jgi:hypothetical protein